MSRVSLIEQLYVKRKSALEFDYDALRAPAIRSIFTPQDIQELYRIATSLRYNANIEKKYELIDIIMKSRGFVKAHSGTNRVVYNFIELPTFVAKVAIDKVGLKDSPAEYKNQEYFKPFCCKIFEVDPTGVIAFVERVNPISSIEEFASVADDIFNMMITKIIGKYVVDDLGVTKYMNYGIRYAANGHTFGPVIIDFPYAYELDGAKLICKKQIPTPEGLITCNGEIDYDAGLNNLVCTKCGRTYKAMDLQKENSTVLIMYSDDKKGDNIKMRARIISGDNKVIADSGYEGNGTLTAEQYEYLPQFAEENPDRVQAVTKKYKGNKKRTEEMRSEFYDSLQAQQYAKMYDAGVFNSIDSAVHSHQASGMTAAEYQAMINQQDNDLSTGGDIKITKVPVPELEDEDKDNLEFARQLKTVIQSNLKTNEDTISFDYTIDGVVYSFDVFRNGTVEEVEAEKQAELARQEALWAEGDVTDEEDVGESTEEIPEAVEVPDDSDISDANKSEAQAQGVTAPVSQPVVGETTTRNNKYDKYYNMSGMEEY